MKFNGARFALPPLGVILAGADGKRLLPLTRRSPATVGPSNSDS